MASELLRIAQLGNSHAQAIAEALPGFRSATATICPFPVFYEWRVQPSGANGGAQTLIIKHVDTEIPIALDDFDCFVVSAAGWWAPRDAHLRGESVGHPLAYVRCAHWGDLDDPALKRFQIVSQAVFADVVDAWVAGHPMVDFVRFLTTGAEKKVIWVTWPVPGSAIFRKDSSWLLNAWYGNRTHGVWREYRAAEHRAVRRLIADFGAQITLLPTPLPVMEDNGFMDDCLVTDDPFHGNVAYGRLVVEQLAEHLRAA